VKYKKKEINNEENNEKDEEVDIENENAAWS